MEPTYKITNEQKDQALVKKVCSKIDILPLKEIEKDLGDF